MNRLYTTFLIMLAAAGVAGAQEQLTKEITIERDIVPQVHSASRPDFFPIQLRFPTSTLQLDAVDYGKISEFGPHVPTLSPALTAPAASLTPYRGYVDVGYFPAANVGLSAGYSIVGTERTSLEVWGQFNNRSYSSQPVGGLEKQNYRHTEGRIGLDFSHKFGDSGTLGISTDVDIASFNQPWSIVRRSVAQAEAAVDATTEIPAVKSQSAFWWGISALWSGRASERFTYRIGAGFDIYNFSKGLPTDEYDTAGSHVVLPALHQTGFNINLGVEKSLSAASAAGIDADARWLHFNSFLQPDVWQAICSSTVPVALPGSKSLGVVGLTPYYRIGSDKYSVKLGARIDFTFNSGKAFHIAPDVLLGANPAEGFGASLRVGGGEHLNSLQSLVQLSPYICQSMAYGVSHKPITADLNLRFGPLKGASLTLNLGYAAANDWLLPYVCGDVVGFTTSNLRSLKAGATARWTFRRLLAFEAGYSAILGKGDKSTWLEWRDRARRVLNAGIEVTPLRNLTIEAVYELRMKRSMPVVRYTSLFDLAESAAESEMPVCFNLRNVSNLSAGVSYRFTEAFTVFARVENILAAHSYELPFVPAQGIHGLVGVGYKF